MSEDKRPKVVFKKQKKRSQSNNIHLSDDKLKFRVGYEFTINGKKIAGEETEASWYLIDQQGKFYSYGPMRPIEPCILGDKLEFKLLINGEYLSVLEIESRLNNER